jgi:hypothetical protein
MSNQGYERASSTPTNPWLARARKALVATGVALVEIANVWAGGPEWLYAVAPGVGAVLVYLTPNAPKYRGTSNS